MGGFLGRSQATAGLSPEFESNPSARPILGPRPLQSSSQRIRRREDGLGALRRVLGLLNCLPFC